MENINAGYGKRGNALPYEATKYRMVAASSVTGFDRIQETWRVDEDGENRLFSTLEAAINASAAGDVILIAPGHTEDIESAGAATVDVAGLQIIGLGSGDNRPVFTFKTAVGASILVSADDVTIKNIVGLAGLDSLTNPFNVTGDDCTLELEWKDGSASVEAVSAVRLDGASNVSLDLVYSGFTAGNALDAAVLLDGCANVRINLDAYGVNNNAWVEMVDVASTNVVVTGQAYTQGVTDSSQLVVDTITGSTWYARLDDLSAAAKVSGGSGGALAADDVGAVASAVAAIQSDLGNPSARTNAQSIEAMLGNPDNAGATVFDAIKATTSSGEADIDVSESDYTNPTELLRIEPNANDTLRDVSVLIDLDKATTGWADVATTETIQFYVLRKVDGTNWRAEPAVLSSAIAGNNADDQMVKIDIGTVGPTEDVAVYVELSAEPGSDSEFPYVVQFSGATASPTITPVAAA